MSGLYPARYWHQLPSGKLQCDLCPRGCKLAEGVKGFCQARQAKDGAMWLTTFGLSTPPRLDPIEKKPLHHFLPGSQVLSFGHPGCNLGCKFCQNWSLSKAEEFSGLVESHSPQDIVRLAQSKGAASVAMTYNDPVPNLEFGAEVAAACQQAGLKVVLVTAGYINPEARAEYFAQVDAANIDLKAFHDAFYKKLCKGRLQPVLDTLCFVRNFTTLWLELTHLLITGWNDDPKETKAMCDWIVENLGPDTPLHLSAFHPAYKMAEAPPTPFSTLRRAFDIAQEAGLRFVYTGNVHDPEGDRTRCPHCHRTVIQRDWYRIVDYRLKGSACGYCGEKIPGCFSAA